MKIIDETISINQNGIKDGERFIEIIISSKELDRLCDKGVVKQIVESKGELINLAVIVNHDIRGLGDTTCHPEQNLKYRGANEPRRKKTITKYRDEC
jgi:hypothetical protein